MIPLRLELKTQGTVFHGERASVEILDLAEQGLLALVWRDRGGAEYLAKKATLKTFADAMVFVATELGRDL